MMYNIWGPELFSEELASKQKNQAQQCKIEICFFFKFVLQVTTISKKPESHLYSIQKLQSSMKPHKLLFYYVLILIIKIYADSI